MTGRKSKLKWLLLAMIALIASLLLGSFLAIESFRRASRRHAIDTAFSELIRYELKVNRQDSGQIQIPISPSAWGEVQVDYGSAFAQTLNRLEPGSYTYQTFTMSNKRAFVVRNDRLKVVSDGNVPELGIIREYKIDLPPQN